MKKIVFIPTWRCQNRCSYCDYGHIPADQVNGYELQAFDKKLQVGAELKWFEWIERLHRFEPYILEMTGGEPTMYDDLDKVLSHIGPDSRWAITSNTLRTDMIERVPGKNNLAWTASYHFHSDEKFMKNIYILQMRGFKPRVTIVVTPDNWEAAHKKIVEISKEVGVNVHMVLKQGFSWQASGKMWIWNETKALAQKTPGCFFVETISDEWKPERHARCIAGGDYFCLFPDGQVHRCYSHILSGLPSVDINDFQPAKEPMPCAVDCMFPCDRETARRTV